MSKITILFYDEVLEFPIINKLKSRVLKNETQKME